MPRVSRRWLISAQKVGTWWSRAARRFFFQVKNDKNIIDTANLPAEGRKFIELREKDFSGNVENIIENANLPVEDGKSSENVFPDNAKSIKEKVFPGNGHSSKEATNLAAQGGQSSNNIPPQQQPSLPQILRDDDEMQPFLDILAAVPGSPSVFDNLNDSIFDDDSDSLPAHFHDHLLKKHLHIFQKYRRYMKRAQPVQWTASSDGINPPTRVTEPSYPPSLSSLFNNLQTPSFTSFQQLFCSTNSAASSHSSHSFPPAASTTSSIFSNLGHKEWLKGSSDQGSVQYPYGGSGSSLNQNLLNFGTALLISPTGLPQVDLGHAPYNTILPRNIEISPTPTGPGPAQVDIGHASSNTILPSNTGISSAGLGHALSNTILPSNTEISSTSLGQADLGHASFNTVLPGNAEISSTGLGHVYLGHPPENDILPGNTEPGGSYGNGDQVPSTYVGFRLARDGKSIQAGQKVYSINAEGVIEIADLCEEGWKSVVDASQKVLLSGNDDGLTETANLPAEGGDFIEPGEKGFSGNVESIIEHCANLPVEGGKSCENVFPDNGESSKEKDNPLGFPGNGESSIEATNVAAAQGGSSSDNIPPRQQPPLPQILRDDAEMQLFLDTMSTGLGSPLVFDDLDDSIFDDDSD